MRGRVKFRVGRIVYVAFSRDETLMGFGFPKEEREWLVGTEPEKFLMPGESDLRFNWVVVRLGAIEPAAGLFPSTGRLVIVVPADGITSGTR